MSNRNNIIIGTAGHVDHGKTCLIRALTGINTDRLTEEKKRGITIELGFAYLDLPDGRRAGIVDVPGHEKFIRNMLAGAGGIDLALLIVAADEGVMPQTLEHLGILSLLDVKRGIIVLTKTDLVDDDWRELVKEDIRGHVEGTFLQDAPIMPVSSVTGEGIEDLKAEIFRLISQADDKKLNVPFRIPVDRVFSMEGFGTVITGTMLEGTLHEGEEVTLYPGEKTGKVRNIQVHSQDEEAAYAGQRVAVNFSNLKTTDIQRGDVVAAPDSMHVSMMADVHLRLLKNIRHGIKNGARLHFYYGSREVLGKALLLNADQLDAGQDCYVQMRMEENIALKAGDHFVVRFYSPLETIGGGIVLDPDPVKHKQGDESVVKGLQLLENGDVAEIVEQGVREGSQSYRPFATIITQFNLEKQKALGAAQSLAAKGVLVRVTDKLYLHADFVQKQGERLLTILNAYHKEFPLKAGMKKEEVRTRFLPQQEQNVADGLLAYYEAEKLVKIVNGDVSEFKFKVKFTEADSQMTAKLEKLYEDAGYTPPSTDDALQSVGGGKAAQQAMSAMITAGKLVRADAQINFARSHYEKAEQDICALTQKNGQVTLAEVRDLLGTSRKFAIAILDNMDRKKVTKKVGDVRVLA